MKTCAVIAEYNPFHQGHIYHLQQTRKQSQCDCLVVILSGPFSSRGLPSLIDPERKTRLALEYGADLVIELPCVYAMQSASQFARYAMESLGTLHIDAFCFGSETNDLAALEAMSAQVEAIPKDPSTSMARNTALHLGNLGANDILGIQYLRHAKDYGIKPLCIQRNQAFKSATATRADFEAGQSGQFLDTYFHPAQTWNTYYPILRTFLLMSDPKWLASLFLMQEGLENRLIENARKYSRWQDFENACITRTYSRARIQRTCMFALLQITKEQMKAHDTFHDVMVLGMNDTGRAFLKTLEDTSHIYTRYAQLPDFLKTVYRKSRDLYNSVMDQPAAEWRIIYEKTPVEKSSQM